MSAKSSDGYQIKELDIFCYYDKQRFTQFSSQDAANWYLTDAPTGKKKRALYPTMGRQHIKNMLQNLFIFTIEPRDIFKSIDFVYVIVGSTVQQIDRNFNIVILSNPDFNQPSGFLSFDYLPCLQTVDSVVVPLVFCMIADGKNMFVIDEANGTMTTVNKGTDPNAPLNPNIVIAFGNRFGVSSLNSTQFTLTQINLAATGNSFDPTTVFTIPGAGQVFAQESGIIREMGVLHNQLYIFTDFTTGIWSNTPSLFNNATFPWKKNTSYEWDYGIADIQSLDIDFGRMAWLAQNRNGLIQFMSTDGQMPQTISTQAINVLLQNSMSNTQTSAYLSQLTNGFLYQYEDSVFYRVSTGTYNGSQILDFDGTANAIEYNYNTQTWHRCIELNGEKNRIQKHVFFNSLHMVLVQGDNAIYEMAGNIYINEVRNPDKTITNPNDPNYFLVQPFRYELTTAPIFEDDYSEFKDDYVEIDFVFGEQNLTIDNTTYFQPNIELYVSDDGGVSFYSADNLQFSNLGIYQWRMRWYQLGCSRNRRYRLVCVSLYPIVILGGVRNTKVVSGGAH